MKTSVPIGGSRGKYQGMLQILRFNWRFYMGAVVVLALIAFGLNYATSPLWKMLAIVCLVPTAFWTLSSLLVSHWVYDRSSICKWTWLTGVLPIPPQNWANIHAGLDESSAALYHSFPGTKGTVLDIFDPVEMTEASIAEARRRPENPVPAVHADFRELTMSAGSLDAVFLIFAAHEIRQVDSRLIFFGELHRVLRRTGCVVMIEHLRDWKNFMAFGPGFMHFQSRQTWLHAAEKIGFKVKTEFGITPFVRIFVFQNNL